MQLLLDLPLFKPQEMVDCFWQLIMVMGDVDQAEGGVGTQLVKKVEEEAAVGIVEALAGFIQDEEGRIVDKGAREEDQALLACREGLEGFLGKVCHVKDVQPVAGGFGLLGRGALVEAVGVEETAGDGVQAGDRLAEVDVQFGGDPADAALDVPDGFTGAAALAEDCDMVGVGLGIVGQDQAEQCGLARTVVAEEGPAFARADGPVDVVQDVGITVAHSDVLHVDERGGLTCGAVGVVCGHGIEGWPAGVGACGRQWGGNEGHQVGVVQ